MNLFFSVLVIGLALGIRHATDADHVVAITTILGKQKNVRVSALIGMLWGIGHAATVTLVAIPIIIYSFAVPPRIGLFFEFLVGMMLVFLGILNFSGISKSWAKRFLPLAHKHAHSSTNGEKHSHFHIHIWQSFNKELHHLGVYHTTRPILIGFVHGLAGSTAIALLILSTIHQPSLAVLYLFVFHLGVIIGMMIITTLLGASIAVAKKRVGSLHTYLVMASGVLSLVFGLYIMYQTGIVGGLFSNNIHWSPQ